MRKLLISLVWVAGAAAAATAATTGTLTEQSQVRARKVVDAAVAAIGGVQALQSIEVVRLDLQGESFPRLQMTTPNPLSAAKSMVSISCSRLKRGKFWWALVIASVRTFFPLRSMKFITAFMVTRSRAR